MALDDLAPLRKNGRAAQPLPSVLSVRSLSRSEVAAHSARETGIAPTPLQRTTARHRKMARAFAEGATTSQVAAWYGMSVSRVSVLKSDPAFQNLIDQCRAEREFLNPKFEETLDMLGMDSMMELQERLENDPESFTNAELALITKLTADRTGRGPTRTEHHNHTVNIGDKLEQARQRVNELSESRIIDVSPNPEGA